MSSINSAKRSTWDRSTFVTFSRYQKNAAEEDSALEFPQLGFSGVKYNWNKKYLLHTVIIHVTWTRFCAFLDLGLRNVHAFLCHLYRCFDPRFKENIHCQPAFIIRDINSCRKGYSKGRLKSRESDHFSVQFAFQFHHNLHHSNFNLDVEKSAVTPFNHGTTSCIVSRIVPLNVDKDGGKFCRGFC